MPLLTYKDLKTYENSKKIVADAMYHPASSDKRFDIFLSHSHIDATLALRVKYKLESYGFSVYVDWLDDPQFDQRAINRKTAERLQMRMRQCKSLAFLDTEGARLSKWTPWEVGFMDSYTKHVFIIPIREEIILAQDYKGQEFFSLYPFLDEEKERNSDRSTLWINSPLDFNYYSNLRKWLNGTEVLPLHR